MEGGEERGRGKGGGGKGGEGEEMFKVGQRIGEGKRER